MTIINEFRIPAPYVWGNGTFDEHFQTKPDQKHFSPSLKRKQWKGLGSGSCNVGWITDHDLGREYCGHSKLGIEKCFEHCEKTDFLLSTFSVSLIV